MTDSHGNGGGGLGLRARHGHDEKWYGVDVLGTGVADMFENNVIEPVSVKQQIINSATECACMLLRIDDVIPSRGRGAPMPQREESGMD